MPCNYSVPLFSSNTVTMTVFRVPTDIQDVFRQLREATERLTQSSQFQSAGLLREI